MVSYFMLSFSRRDVLDEIWDLIESVPENVSTTLRCLLSYLAFHLLHLTLSCSLYSFA